MQNERSLICVDGLDEARQGTDALIDDILALLSTLGARIVASTRPGAVPAVCASPPWASGHLLPFDLPRLTSFVRAWFGRERSAARRVVRHLAPHASGGGLQELARIPLSACICHLAEQRTDLPATRSAVLRDIALALLSGRWHASDHRRTGAAATSANATVRLTLLSDSVVAPIGGPDFDVWKTTLDVDDFSRQLQMHRDYDAVANAAVPTMGCLARR